MRGDRKQTLRGCGSCSTVLRYQQPSDVGGCHSANHALSSSHCPARRLAYRAAAFIARLPESAGVQAATYAVMSSLEFLLWKTAVHVMCILLAGFLLKNE